LDGCFAFETFLRRLSVKTGGQKTFNIVAYDVIARIFSKLKYLWNEKKCCKLPLISPGFTQLLDELVNGGAYIGGGL